ncbi:MAG: hypothetical protein PHW62_00950 [Candidatus Ratteibacteria bacterium]|nr:hypothetical protein [Candidatus Ratteibacteria bacterium]
MDENKELKKEKNRRKYCKTCKSGCDSGAVSVDADFEHYRCRKCGDTWAYPVLKEERIIKKGFLQNQLIQVDALIHDNMRLVKRYPNDLALQLALTGLMNHRQMLCLELEMIHSPVPFSTNAD